MITFRMTSAQFSRRSIVTALLAVLAIMAAPLAAVTPASAQCACQESTLDKIKRTKVFLAGVRLDYPPLGSMDNSGNNIGFGPDLAREFAKRLGVEAKMVSTTGKNRIANLVNNIIDAEIGPASITRTREEVVDFSIIYLWDQGALLVRQGESVDAKEYTKAKGKKLGTAQGSIYPDLFRNHVGEGDFTLFQEYTDGVLALLNKRIDGLVLNQFNAVAFKKKFEGQVTSGKPFVELPLGITLRQNDSKWRNWVNHTLQDLWAEGVYQALFEKHFGEQPSFYMWSPVMLEPK